MTQGSQAKSKLELFQAEVRKARIRTVVSLSVVVFCSVLLFMIASGDRFNHFLAFLGLRGIFNEESGVYTDCSNPKNKDVSYCQPKTGSTEQNWQNMQKGGRNNPFTLYKLDE